MHPNITYTLELFSDMQTEMLYAKLLSDSSISFFSVIPCIRVACIGLLYYNRSHCPGIVSYRDQSYLS